MLYSLFLLYVQIEVYQNVLKLSSLPCAFTMFFVTESSILDVARDCKSTYEGTQMSLQNVRSSHELSLLGIYYLLTLDYYHCFLKFITKQQMNSVMMTQIL